MNLKKTHEIPLYITYSSLQRERDTTHTLVESAILKYSVECVL